MNRFTHLLILRLLLTATLLAGCSRDELIAPETGNKVEILPDGNLRIPLTLNICSPQRQEVATRSANTNDEEKIESIMVLVFEATDNNPLPDNARLLQRVAGVAGGGNQAYVTLEPYEGQCQLRILTNLSAGVTQTINGFRTVGQGAPVTTFGAFKDLTSELDAFYADKATPGATPSPPYTMSSERIYLTEIAPETTNNLMAYLYIDAARIDITATAQNFVIQSVTLLNGARQGYLRPHDPLPVNLGGGTIKYTEKMATSGTVSPIYLYPNNGDSGGGQGTNPTYLVLKATHNGVAGYYKIAIRYLKGTDTAPNYTYNIVRNTLYAINITEVRNGGYATFQDAEANTPANIEYEITVIDEKSTDLVIGNGQYYMGFSNSEVLYYAEPNASTYVTLATLTLGTAAGEILPSAQSRTITTSATASEMTLTTTNADLNVAAGVPVEIKAMILKSDIDRTVTVRIGNLVKSLRVRSKETLYSLDNEFIAVDNVVQAQVNVNSDNNFLRLATSNSAYPSTYTAELSNESGTAVYLCAPAASSTLRTAEAYLSRTGSDGRIKAIVHQKMIDPETITNTRLLNSYVGAFWRAGQTGERIIRIQTPAGSEGAWDAQVIWMDNQWGDDRIRFSASPSTDPNVSFTADKTPADMNILANDALYNVSGGFSSASGTTTTVAPNDYIYFRMGISAKNLGTKPRYAVVLLRYNNLRKNHLLYLRQGDQADAVGNSDVEWLPYNVGKYDSPMLYGYDYLTAYPTQAGYFKNFSSTYNMWTPHESTGWSGESNTSINNVCPTGYKIPTANGTTGMNYNKGQVNEMGSLFVGTNAASPQKHLFGYYADGYFDRRQIVDISAVSKTNDKVAYQGYLFYNKSTFASLFLPAAGYRHYSGGSLNIAGYYGYYWSSSTVNSNSWSLDFGSSLARQINYSRTHGFSVRCIRQ